MWPLDTTTSALTPPPTTTPACPGATRCRTWGRPCPPRRGGGCPASPAWSWRSGGAWRAGRGRTRLSCTRTGAGDRGGPAPSQGGGSTTRRRGRWTVTRYEPLLAADMSHCHIVTLSHVLLRSALGSSSVTGRRSLTSTT